MDRRNFLKISAATSAGSALTSCGNPDHQLIRFIPEETITPGVARWKPSICPLCPAGCGMLVRIMDGDAEVTRNGQNGVIERGLAKKLEGDPAHAISQGKLCVRGQAAIQIAYHPDRLQQPLKRTGARGSGEYEAISWDQALTELISRLDRLAETGSEKSLAFLTRPLRGQRQFLLAEFLKRFGAPTYVEYEVFSERVLRHANARSFGREQLPTFDLARARYILSFGADFLGTWNSPVSQSVAYGEMRQGRPGLRGKFVQVEARMSQTGANADEWLSARPGTEGFLALGLAHSIVKQGLRRPEAAGEAGRLIEGWSTGLAGFTPVEVENQTGIASARVERLAREFAENLPAVALIGGAPLAHTNGLFNALAVNALNALVGAVGQPGGVFFTPQPTSTDLHQTRTLDQLTSDTQLLLLHDANPVFGAPPGRRAKDVMMKIPYIVSFGSFLDETSILADLVLPDHAFLESWVDHVPESGAMTAVTSVAPAAMRPLYDTRSMPDVLLEIGRRLKRPLKPPFEWQRYDQMLRNSPPFQGGVAEGRGGEVSTQAFGAPDHPDRASGAVTPPWKGGEFAEAQFDGDPAEFPYHFLPYASQAFFDGSLAHLPWLQELPDVISTAMWSSWIEINPKTAASVGIRQGDLLEVSSRHGSLRAPAVLYPGIAPDVIAMPVGQGHETFTRYASGRGANPLSILGDGVEQQTGAHAWAATRVRISKVDGRGDLILFASEMREPERRRR